MKPDPPIDLERQIALSTAAGREALAIQRRVIASLSPERRFMKSFELTETARQIMREGLRMRHPEADEATIERLAADQLLSHQKLDPDTRREVNRRRAALRCGSA